jgi:hypothetical protein
MGPRVRGDDRGRGGGCGARPRSPMLSLPWSPQGRAGARRGAAASGDAVLDRPGGVGFWLPWDSRGAVGRGVWRVGMSRCRVGSGAGAHPDGFGSPDDRNEICQDEGEAGL